MSNFQISKNNI